MSDSETKHGRGRCIHCGGAIVSFRKRRDWDRRDAHFMCHRKWLDEQHLKEYMATWVRENMPKVAEGERRAAGRALAKQPSRSSGGCV